MVTPELFSTVLKSVGIRELMEFFDMNLNMQLDWDKFLHEWRQLSNEDRDELKELLAEHLAVQWLEE